MIRNINDFQNYGVDETGNIFNLITGKKLQPKKDSHGYLQVYLSNGKIKKLFLVHRLVAQEFLPNPNQLPQVNHKDENKQNNRIENLEWCDSKYNSNYGLRNNKISKSKMNNTYNCKRVFCLEIGQEFHSAKEAGRELSIDSSSILKVCKGKRKSANGLHWEYVNNEKSKRGKR